MPVDWQGSTHLHLSVCSHISSSLAPMQQIEHDLSYKITISLFQWQPFDLYGFKISGRGVDSTAADLAVTLAVYVPPTHST